MLRARNVTRGTVLASSVEVADGLWAKFMGLMGRAPESFAPGSGCGLWLPDSNGIHMMFMRFPIDAVFLGGGAGGAGGRRVLSLHSGLAAWRGVVPLVRGAKGVLELPVGAIEASSTGVGDVIVLEPAENGPD